MITFLPSMLSPLHLACYSRSQKEAEEKKRRFQKLSQEMKEITVKCHEKKVPQEEMSPNIKLFYDVYHHIDDLSLKELKVLREYGSLLDDVNCMRPIREMDSAIEVFRISRLEDTINHHIKEKKRETFPRRFHQ